jgi:hypothetical protein
VVPGGEDAGDVGEDVVVGEEDGLASAPEDLAEELVRVERVGEGDREQLEGDTITNHVEAVHDWRAPWEVGEALGEEVFCEIDGASPPGLRPHAERGLDDRPQRVLLLWCGTRTTKGRSVVLHLLGWVVLGIGKGRGREVGGVCERKRKIGPF